jgi:hypothetical protein
LSKIYSSERHVERAEYWRKAKSDLVLVPFISGLVFLIALWSVNGAVIVVLVDAFHWIAGKFTKPPYPMRFPAFALAMSLNLLAIYVAAKFF